VLAKIYNQCMKFGHVANDFTLKPRSKQSTWNLGATFGNLLGTLDTHGSLDMVDNLNLTHYFFSKTRSITNLIIWVSVIISSKKNPLCDVKIRKYNNCGIEFFFWSPQTTVLNLKTQGNQNRIIYPLLRTTMRRDTWTVQSPDNSY
jgi:hypothetical protein